MTVPTRVPARSAGARIQGTWSGAEFPVTQHVCEPAGAGTTAAAMSRALGALSHEIARELMAIERGMP